MKKLGSFLLGFFIAATSAVLGQVPINGLPEAHIPLTGNETVVMNQANTGCPVGGCTVQAPVSSFAIGVNDLTAGTGITLTPNPILSSGVISLTNPVPTVAAPSATIGLTPIDGSTGNFMDAGSAPALSQSISPTMIGNWNFTPSSGIGLTATAVANSFAAKLIGTTGTGTSDGLDLQAGTNASDTTLLIQNAAASQSYLKMFGDGGIVLNGATGGDKGPGTMNTTQTYINGVAVGTGSGSVTSVGMTVPTCFSITGTPVTTSGVLALGMTGATTTVLQGDGTCIAKSSLVAVPGGSTTQMQYNNGGVFGGASNFTYNNTTEDLAIGAPTSGIPLSLTQTAASNSAALQLTASGTGSGYISFTDGSSGSNRNWYLGTSLGGSNNFSLVDNTAGTTPFSVSSTGTVTIAIPSSADALVVNGLSGAYSTEVVGGSTAGSSFGLVVLAGTNSSDNAFDVQNRAGTTNMLLVRGDGSGELGAGASASALTWSAAGDIGVNTPTSGTALAVAGAASNNAMTISSPNTAGSSFGLLVAAGTNASDRSVLFQNATGSNLFEVTGSGQTLMGFGGAGDVFNNNGNVAFGAPTSGSTLALAGAANASTLQLNAPNTTGQSFGATLVAGTNSSDWVLFGQSAAGVNLFEFHGDGGVTVGAPTGGDQGLGTVNMTGCFVNGVACAATTQTTTTASIGTSGVCTTGVTAGNMRFVKTGNTVTASWSGTQMLCAVASAVNTISFASTIPSGYIPTNTNGCVEEFTTSTAGYPVQANFTSAGAVSISVFLGGTNQTTWDSAGGSCTYVLN
jgi:hypothetical protein